MSIEKTREDRDRREAKADQVVELIMDSVTAFLTGKAFLDVLPGPNVEGSKVVYFRLETPVI